MRMRTEEGQLFWSNVAFFTAFDLFLEGYDGTRKWLEPIIRY